MSNPSMRGFFMMCPAGGIPACEGKELKLRSRYFFLFF